MLSNGMGIVTIELDGLCESFLFRLHFIFLFVFESVPGYGISSVAKEKIEDAKKNNFARKVFCC